MQEDILILGVEQFRIYVSRNPEVYRRNYRWQIADGSMITRFVPLQEVIFVIVRTCSSFSVICMWLIGSRHAQLPPSLSNKSITDVMLSDSVLASTALLFVESAVIRRSYVVVGSFVSAHAVYN